MLKSAEVLTVSVSDAVSLAPFGSETAEVTVTVLVWAPVVDDGTVYVTVIVAPPDAGIVPNAQVKLGPPAQLPCDGVTEPWENPAGHESLTLTPVASDGPAFATVIVYV